MITLDNPVLYVPMALLTAFVVTYIAIPSIINVARKKNLYDEPGARKAHSSKIPTLGGVAIFGGFIIALSIWSSIQDLKLIQYTLAASCLIFLVGAKDDIVELAAYKKFTGQIIATGILVILGNLRFTNFHDLFGGGEVPYWLSIIITGFTILVIINSFNLIDGINALSGTIGAIISLAFGIWFWMNGDYQMVVLAASLLGALLAFLRFNVTPASIFMGDTGSLLIGLLSAVMALRFSELNLQESLPYPIESAPAVSIGFLALPLFDLLRAFSIRIFKGKSPFSPDRNHLHHMMLDCGLTHMQGTYILAFLQILFISLSIKFQGLGSWTLIAILLGIAISFAVALDILRKKRRKAKALNQAKN